MSGGGVVAVAVRVKPGAARARVGGHHPGRYGPALVVAVTAPAVDGKATEAARRALAEALGVPPRAVTLWQGAASRDKLFTVTVPDDRGTGDRDAVVERMRTLRDGPGGESRGLP